MSSTLSHPSFSPPIHRNLAKLDKNLFVLEIPTLAVRVPVSGATEFMRNSGKEFILRIARIPSILADNDSKTHRLVLLDPSLQVERLPTKLQSLLTSEELDIVNSSVKLDYDYWSADQILESILPEALLADSPSSFTQVGHIAHLNLRDEYLPFKHLIGQVILDKNKNLRTVVNKLDTIDNEYRNFRMEVIAGEDDFQVTLSESNCSFTFDFSAVYWNSRLQGEHAKLVESFSVDDVVVDAFAGVGPFAVPAGKKGCGVMASDLNPASASALAVNVMNNKVGATVRTANEDARAYIRHAVTDIWTTPFPAFETQSSIKAREKLARREREAIKALFLSGSTAEPLAAASIEPIKPPRKLVNHFVMNLPATALEFLDAYRGLYIPLLKMEGAKEAIETAGGVDSLPIVHCYCFTKDVEGAEADILARASKAMGLPVTSSTKDFKLRFIRDVAPKKEMYCLDFRLTWEMVTTLGA